MRPQIEFQDINIGDEFECYGDVHLNYNSRKICKCIKLDAITAREIDGIVFNIRYTDTVFEIEDKDLVKKMESFLDECQKTLPEDEYQKIVHELMFACDTRMKELNLKDKERLCDVYNKNKN